MFTVTHIVHGVLFVVDASVDTVSLHSVLVALLSLLASCCLGCFCCCYDLIVFVVVMLLSATKSTVDGLVFSMVVFVVTLPPRPLS